jgi:cell division protein FtsB
MMLIMLYFIAGGVINVIRLQHERKQKAAVLHSLESKYDQQVKTNNELKRQLEQKSAATFIEQQARKLDYIYPDEHIFIDTSGGG